MKKTTSPYVVVKRSKIHSKGVYAKKDIPSDARIIEYVGEKITKRESEIRGEKVLNGSMKNPEKGAVYLFELNKRHDIDGYVPYNTARFINHTCDPNCEALNIRGHIWICALRDIKKGEELSYDYGYDTEDFEEHLCCCGSKNCFGYIVAEEDRPKIRRKLQRKKLKRKTKRKSKKKR